MNAGPAQNALFRLIAAIVAGFAFTCGTAVPAASATPWQLPPGPWLGPIAQSPTPLATAAVIAAHLRWAESCDLPGMEGVSLRLLSQGLVVRQELLAEQRLRDSAIWGNVELEEPAEPPCEAGSRNHHTAMGMARFQMIDILMGSVDKQFAEATVPLAQGVWVGNIRLCRDTVQNVTQTASDWGGNEQVLQVTLADASAAFAELTSRSVGVRLQIRIEGQVVSEPMIHEPITGGQLQISGADVATLANAVAAMQAPC